MKKLKIGIDIDNVIADSYPRYIDAFNKKFGVAVKYEEIFDFYYLENYVGVDRAQTSQFIETVLHSNEFQLAIPPYEEPQKIIKKWADQGFSIHYITSRPDFTKTVTLKWLKKHGFLAKGTKLHLLDINIHSKDTDYKKEIVNKWKVNLMIEDSLDIASALDIPVFLLDRPWNQGKLPKNVTRVNNWAEIDQRVEKLTR